MSETTPRYRTTEAFISGGICGSMWMPAVTGGIPFRVSLKGPFGLMERFAEPASFRDALSSLLSEKGGDFQDPHFTADTRIVVIRKRHNGPAHYDVHVWERELTDLPTVVDFVDVEHFTGDFMGDE